MKIFSVEPSEFEPASVLNIESLPIAIFLSPVVCVPKAFIPIPIFIVPVVKASKAQPPKAVL